MTDVYNFDGYQIPHIGIEGGMTGAVSAQGRAIAMRMSNFGDLVGGLRSADDYKRTTLGFKDKGELENPDIPSFLQEAEYTENPYVWGSTVKRVRNDEFTVMGMGSRRGYSATSSGTTTDLHGVPSFDVMDTNLAVDDGTNVPKRFPGEGWATFGGRKGGPFGYVSPAYRTDR